MKPVHPEVTYHAPDCECGDCVSGTTWGSLPYYCDTCERELTEDEYEEGLGLCPICVDTMQ